MIENKNKDVSYQHFYSIPILVFYWWANKSSKTLCLRIACIYYFIYLWVRIENPVVSRNPVDWRPGRWTHFPPIQIVGRIQFLAVVGLKSPESCCLSLKAVSTFFESAHTLTNGPFHHVQSHQQWLSLYYNQRSSLFFLSAMLTLHERTPVILNSSMIWLCPVG